MAELLQAAEPNQGVGRTNRLSLTSEYRRQFRWREWPTVLGSLPPVEGRTVLDLGCGVGDLAAEFVARGARVVGIDGNEELVREARSQKLPTAEFRTSDLRTNLSIDVEADGLWCSFTAAYFPDLPGVLAKWRPGTRNVDARCATPPINRL